MDNQKGIVDSEVIIKLERNQVKALLNLIRLGVESKHWCSKLTETECPNMNSDLVDFDIWLNVVRNISASIVDQTGITSDEWLDNLHFLTEIEELVNNRCNFYKNFSPKIVNSQEQK